MTHYKSVPIRVVFGVPSRSCVGHGICYLLPWSNTQLVINNICPIYEAACFISFPGVLQIKISLMYNVKKYLKKYLDAEIFILEETFDIPFFICELFELPKGSKIYSGFYSIKQIDDFAVIYLLFY